MPNGTHTRGSREAARNGTVNGLVAQGMLGRWVAGAGDVENDGGVCSFHSSQALMSLDGLVAGTTVLGQYISRNGGFAPPNNVGWTDPISFTICP